MLLCISSHCVLQIIIVLRIILHETGREKAIVCKNDSILLSPPFLEKTSVIRKNDFLLVVSPDEGTEHGLNKTYDPNLYPLHFLTQCPEHSECSVFVE